MTRQTSALRNPSQEFSDKKSGLIENDLDGAVTLMFGLMLRRRAASGRPSIFSGQNEGRSAIVFEGENQ
jgi:hypothetical protein